MAAAISVSGLRKSYGSYEAVRGISFEIEEGECFGFLGTNGAGKTTTIEILEGYRPRNGGTVSVLGTDPAKPTRTWRERIGIVLQEVELDPNLTVNETVSQFATFYSAPRPVAETIELVGLAERRKTRISGLSGGQKRRVDVALGERAYDIVIGRGLIVHADPDDYRTQPTGNAGGRIACGVIQAG